MCGISGFVGIGDDVDLAAMAAEMRHRGPDDEQFWTSTSPFNVGFGFRRLTVLDPEGGTQPTSSKDGSVTLVFNGEIYNHRTLRKQLEHRGHRFVSDHSDTEVLLNAYMEWGENLLSRVRGMFAFALWDARKATLIAATDPVGKKPFYYARLRNGFVFASELRAIAAHQAVSKEVSRLALARYFAFGFIPEPETMLKGVSKLGAGRILRFEAPQGGLTLERYWQFRISAQPRAGDWSEWKEALRVHLETSVARRLEADVPLGFLLSGGIDSAVIAALAKKQRRDDDLYSYTIGFQEQSYDETNWARATADAIGLKHRTQMLAQSDVASVIDDVLPRMDEPLADPSLIPTYLACRFARQEVTVALTGDGADEMFAGYDTFAALPLAEFYSTVVPRAAHRIIEAAAGCLPKRDRNLSLDFKLRRALRGLRYPAPVWHAAWLAPVDTDELSKLLGQDITIEDVYAPVIEHWEGSQAANRRDRSLEYYTEFYLQSDIIPKTDRSSMLCSLELRMPFLDRDLVEFCATLPYHAKYGHGGVRKRLLRDVAADLLPPEVLNRPKKGFGMPVSSWLRGMEQPSLATSDALGLNSGMLAGAWSEHGERRNDHRGMLWAWLCLDRWAERAL